MIAFGANRLMTDIHQKLASAGVCFADGLRPDEFGRVETMFDFVFPPDLRAFLADGLPVSDGWIDWRHADESAIRKWMRWPADGICFDIEHNAFWMPQWGSRPTDLTQAWVRARSRIAAAPVLIPVFRHRFLPATPALAGNPVFSVHQTDIICYGADLPDYLRNEFPEAFGRKPSATSRQPRRIDLWSDIEELDW